MSSIGNPLSNNKQSIILIFQEVFSLVFSLMFGILIVPRGEEGYGEGYWPY